MRGSPVNGERLRKLRRDAALTQEELAAAADCDSKTIRAAEQSRRVDISTVRRIADSLGVEYRELFQVTQPEAADDQVMQAVVRYMTAFNSRNAAGVASAFRPDGVVHVRAHPSLPGAGEWRGRPQIQTWAGICFETYRASAVTQSTARVTVAGDRVFVAADQPTVQHMATGQQATVAMLSDFQVTDGELQSLTIYIESGVMEEMIGGPASST